MLSFEQKYISAVSAILHLDIDAIVPGMPASSQEMVLMNKTANQYVTVTVTYIALVSWGARL